MIHAENERSFDASLRGMAYPLTLGLLLPDLLDRRGRSTPNGVYFLYDSSPHYSRKRRLILNRISGDADGSNRSLIRFA